MNTNAISTVQVNGQEVVNFVPDNSTPSAIVSLNVIQRLAKLLPSADLDEIKKDLKRGLADVNSLEEYVNLLSSEVDFHKSVNLITEFNLEISRETFIH